MFETNFSYKSMTPLPPTVSFDDALKVLHDFETVNKLNPDVRGAKPIVPKTTPKSVVSNSSAKSALPGDTPLGDVQYWEIEDDLPFIPKRLFSGTVHYQADYVPVQHGCNITIHAPGGFTSINYWRLVMNDSNDASGAHEELVTVNEAGKDSAQIKSKDLMHFESDGARWSVQITSDAKCNMTFATFVRGFLKNSHGQLQQALIDKCIASKDVSNTTRSRRPTIGRRKSSMF